MSTNHRFPIPEYDGISDARFVFIELDSLFGGPEDGAKKTLPWFNEDGMKIEMTKHEYFDLLGKTPPEAIARVLKERDVKKFNPKLIPASTYLQENKLFRLSAMERWWNYCLSCEEIVEKHAWGSILAQSYIHEAFCDFVDKQRHTLNNRDDIQYTQSNMKVQFWRRLKEMAVYETGPRTSISKVKHRTVTFASLEDNREKFRHYVQDDSWTFDE